MARGAEREQVMRTRVAVIGTLAEFHPEPVPYDLAGLVDLVREQHPDLLCLDITDEQWATRTFGDLPPEYRDALIPLAEQTDIVVVPVAGSEPPAEPMATGWRGAAVRLLRRCLNHLPRTARGPVATSEGVGHAVADTLYWLIATVSGSDARKAWQEHTKQLVARVTETARRDPGRCILVAVNVRHCHHVRRALRRHPEMYLVRYDRSETGIARHGGP